MLCSGFASLFHFSSSLPQLPRYCSSCLFLPLNISLFCFCFLPLTLLFHRPLPPYFQLYIAPSFVSNCAGTSSHLPGPARLLKLHSNYYSPLIRLWGAGVRRWRSGKGGDWETRKSFFFIAAFHHSQRKWNYLGGNDHRLCVCWFTFIHPAVVCVSELWVWVSACTSVLLACTRGTLIPAPLSNYLNCAYRSYCTAHFPLESYTLSSCLPAALAVEISTLGNFVLHNKYCTWGMVLCKKKKKKVWTERKTAF